MASAEAEILATIDRMKTPTLSFDAIAAALAVLGATTLGACDKAPDKASPAPEASGTAVATAAASAATTAAEPPKAAPPPTPTAAVEAVEAGSPKAPQKGGSASCGAGSCSADMKKGK